MRLAAKHSADSKRKLLQRMTTLKEILRRHRIRPPYGEELLEYVYERLFSEQPRICARALQRSTRRDGRHIVIITPRLRRRAASALPDCGVEEEFADDALTPEAEAEYADERRLLHAILATLKPVRREVFRLYRVEGLTEEEIAERLGIKLSSVTRHVARAMILYDEVQEVLESSSGVVEKTA